ncbi:target of wingless isoform X1 [Augochlora pura]
MGCGQSKISNIYPKNKKNKNNSGKKNGESVGSASVEQKNGNGSAKNNKTNNNGVEVNRNEEQNGTGDKSKKKPSAPGNGPLLQQTEISTSQLDFFKMLDEKIENGPDYDETMDVTARAERLSSHLRQWELASVSWSNVRSSISNSSRHSLSAKDREGMRNIVGGRPESAPIYTRNANRVDGLQETHHCPSPSMPRHVLESITQSPTQSLKNSTPPGSGSSPTSLRYHDTYKECNANQPLKSVKVHYAGQSPVNGEYVTQQALYREQYLQQTGIITVPPQYTAGSPAGNLLRNNPYVQQYQITGSQHFSTPRKRGFNTAQMT